MFYNLPNTCYELIDDNDDVVLLESSKCDQDNCTSLLFVEPTEKLKIFSIGEVPELFTRIEQFLEQGYFIAGYFSYECGFHFENIVSLPSSDLPIAWFGVYRHPIVFDHRTGKLKQISRHDVTLKTGSNSSHGESRMTNLRLAINPDDYEKKIERIKEYIRSGDTYQINLTTTYNFEFEGATLAFYQNLKKKQRVPYSAYIRSGERTIVCCSPELFFKRSGNTIVTKPMKGTAQRGKTNEEDELLMDWLRHDKKNQSENIMIVDLLRNDVGRISKPGTVRVSEMFSVEKFESLLQMTSAIEGMLRPDVRYYDIFRSLFPCGSVTGAPKIRSMQIINELEERRRGVYTGAIGYFAPNDEAIFNVAIRTVVIDGNKGEMGVGGGIVYDSVAREEFAECELKGRFLTSPNEEFMLLESLLWNNGYPFIEQHIERLRDSARYFEYHCDGEEIKLQLEKYAHQFSRGVKYKVRLTLDRNGTAVIEHTILEKTKQQQLRVMIADVRTNSTDKFLYHKTTNRRMYDTMHGQAVDNGFADVIFLNEKDEVAEGTISNVFIKKDNRLITPPLSCGLLNGVYRQHVLRTDPNACEQVLRLDDLYNADAVYICNAVRGMREARLSQSPAGVGAGEDSVAKQQ